MTRAFFAAAAVIAALLLDPAPALAAAAPYWSPYVAGAGIGLIACLGFLLSDKALGASSSYATTAGLLEKHLLGPQAMQKQYWQEHEPAIGWQWMLIAGVVVGSLISSLAFGTFRFELVPDLWAVAQGGGWLVRLIVAFVGGALIGVGARWAEGCTSGHGISGTLQLVVSSWIALACFFVGGVVTAYLLYF
jgi:hypothetical protein